MKKKLELALFLAFLGLIFPLSVFAAPLAEAEAVNLPGWLGGLLTVLALLMPVFFRIWVNQNK